MCKDNSDKLSQKNLNCLNNYDRDNKVKCVSE